MVNLVWMNTYISEYVIYNWVGIVEGNISALHTNLYVFTPHLASTDWHAIGTK